MSENLSYRMLQIGGAPAGILGIDELFEELFEDDCAPGDQDLGVRLIQGVKANNYIPKPALNDYKIVLLEEYHRFYTTKTMGTEVVSRDYGQWEGHPRENIPWFPTVSPELCNGCGKCLEICPKDVFVMDDAGKAVVDEPFLCIVGCCICKSACDPEAILMPAREMLDSYRHGQRKST